VLIKSNLPLSTLSQPFQILLITTSSEASHGVPDAKDWHEQLFIILFIFSASKFTWQEIQKEILSVKKSVPFYVLLKYGVSK
jgi:hypothetical protein